MRKDYSDNLHALT
jgi:hypothetical protein